MEGRREKKLTALRAGNASEIVHYRDPEIPLYIETEKLTDYVNMRSLPHWHRDMELMYIHMGRMWCHVDGEMHLLNEDDAVLINTRQIHYYTSAMGEECVFTNILYQPSLFQGCRGLYDKCVRPIVDDPDFCYILIPRGHPRRPEITALVKDLIQISEAESPGYELLALGHLSRFMGSMVQHPDQISPFERRGAGAVGSDIQAQRDMLTFIQTEYMNPVALQDIAQAGHVSRSKCCQLFKRYIQQSPMEYLNEYRLEVSRGLIAAGGRSVTEAALECGFGQASYFIRQFKRKYGTTPKKYAQL